MGNICPCKDCKNRELGCHSSCNNYAVWKKVITAEKLHVNSKRAEQSMIRRDTIYRVSKMKRQRATAI